MYKFIIIIFIFLISCSKNEQEIPTYITINEFNLSSTSFSGSNSKNISDVWFYVNDSLQGIYEFNTSKLDELYFSKIDVFLKNDSLYVTHSEDEIIKNRDIESLYLKPIRNALELGFRLSLIHS